MAGWPRTVATPTRVSDLAVFANCTLQFRRRTTTRKEGEREANPLCKRTLRFAVTACRGTILLVTTAPSLRDCRLRGKFRFLHHHLTFYLGPAVKAVKQNQCLPSFCRIISDALADQMRFCWLWFLSTRYRCPTQVRSPSSYFPPSLMSITAYFPTAFSSILSEGRQTDEARLLSEFWSSRSPPHSIYSSGKRLNASVVLPG